MKLFMTGMICLLSLAASPAVAQQNSLHGLWIGGHPATEGYVMVRMQIGLDSAAADRRASINVWGRKPQTSLITLNGNRANFQFDERGGRATVTATLRGDTLQGSVRVGKDTKQLRLMRIETTPPELKDRIKNTYEGTYETDDHQLVRFDAYSEGGSMMYINYTTGENRDFFLTRNGLIAGPTFFLPSPPTMRLQEVKDSLDKPQIILRDPSGEKVLLRTVRRFEFSNEEIEVKSDVTISGTLVKPRGRGPFPVVVFVHGSGPWTRGAPYALTEYFAANGIASWTYDKRGTGKSGGVYVHNVDSARFELLAADAIAGVKMLAKRPDIDTNRIGIWGISQAGWIIPIVTARAPELDFAVIVSGPLTTLSEENYFSSLTGEGADVPKRSRAEIAMLMKAHRPTGFDPIPFIRQMRIPSVWIFGGNDDSVPVDESIEALQALRKEGYPFELAWFPSGNHQMWETTDWSRQYAPLIHRYVPQYFDTTLRWVLDLSNR
jgi:dipeptidyl aminopeptidase/acylaminoacyl peptidase